ncbi:MAG: DUF58 domain-containing protein [Caldisericia bacterium]|nr:DUF58 domain-containing protein [Caldisericia bacterium]
MFKNFKKEIILFIILFIGILLNSKFLISISIFFVLYILFYKNFLRNEIKNFNYSIKISPSFILEGEFLEISYFLKFFKTNLINFELIPSLPTYFIPIENKNLYLEIYKNNEFIHKFRVRAKKRGKYFLGSFKVRVYDILGLVNIEQFFDLKIEVVVYPKMIDIKKSIIKMREPSFGIKVKEKIFEDFTSIQGHRKYTGNEELKKINWKLSAHTGELLVKEFPSTAITSVTLIIDTFGSNNPRNQEIYEEHVTTISSSFIYFFERSKFYYGLWIPEYLRIEEKNGKDHLIKVLSVISDLKNTKEIDFSSFIIENSRKIKELRNVLIIKRTINIPELYNLIKTKSMFSNFTIFLLPDFGFLYPWEKPHPYNIQETEEIEYVRKIKDSLKRDGINIIIIRGNESIKDLVFV